MKQKNALAETLVSAGLKLIEFELALTGGEGEQAYSVEHAPSASTFRINDEYLSKSNIRRVKVIWWIGDGPRIRKIAGAWDGVSVKKLTWDGVLAQFSLWVAGLQDQIDIPDLWAESRREREFLSASGYETVGNTPFTAAEQAEIKTQLREIKKYAQEALTLSDEQMALMEARFDEAETAARHIGRKDWLLLFMGIMFTLIVTGVLPPNVVQHIFEMALHGLSHLFGGGGEGLKIPAIT